MSQVSTNAWLAIYLRLFVAGAVQLNDGSDVIANTKKLRLNADVGEGLETDQLLYPYLDQANIACGGHAGSNESMQRAVQACLANEVMIGAHPSYPDRANFGRVSMNLEPDALFDTLCEQVGALDDICTSLGGKLCYIKPHGALYNDLFSSPALFKLVLRVTADTESTDQLMVQAGKGFDAHQTIAKQFGIDLISEAFTDRLYLSDGRLSSRADLNSVHQSKSLVVQQAAQLIKQGSVTPKSGNALLLDAQSLCVHGDNPASVEAISEIGKLLRA